MFTFCAAICVAIVVNYALALWIELPGAHSTYRRIGPSDGPQTFCAGSSLLQFGLSWPEISEGLHEGIESWGVAGSTPSEWEQFQKLAGNTNLMIVGVSLFDLNERHVCEVRANIVPLGQTIRDLWRTRSGWEFSKELLSQYPLSWTRWLFPAAGRPLAVMIRLRRKISEQLHLSRSRDNGGDSLVVPREPVLKFGESTEKVSNWSRSKVLRAIAELRNENHGLHTFGGPKTSAMERMLVRAQEKGAVIGVVLPVSPAYVTEFGNPKVTGDFEGVLRELQQLDPQAHWVRLDKLSALNSNECFSDLVHLNGAGRRIATEAFLDWFGRTRLNFKVGSAQAKF